MATPETVIAGIDATRTFGVTSQGLLTGLYEHRYVWSEGENTAACRWNQRDVYQFGSHVAPNTPYRCGFYGYTAAAPNAPAPFRDRFR